MDVRTAGAGTATPGDVERGADRPGDILVIWISGSSGSVGESSSSCSYKNGLPGVLWALRKYHGDGAARHCLMLTELEQRAVARAQAPLVEPEVQAPPAPPKPEPVQMEFAAAAISPQLPSRRTRR